MNNKLLIETLLKHQPISAYNISKIINTSKKTVYNSIDEINSGEVIIFSQDGKFFGDKEKLNEYLESNKNLFVNRRERILLKLLLKEDGIDYFDLANYFYVSDSTILNDVTKINKTYEVKIKRSKDMLYLDIDKDKKSELLQTILRSVNNNKIVTLKNLYDYVDPKSYLDTLISIVTKCLSKQDLKLDNKLYIDFIVNLLIIVRDSYNIEAYINKEDIEYKSPYEFIKNNIEYEFQIKLSEHNKKYLQNEVNMVFYEKFDYKNQDYKMLLERIFSTIKEKFDIELTYTENELFLNHLLMMVNRVQNGVVIESPITKIIKTENVLFFELALVIASEIEKYFNLKRKINENEVALIALYVGNIISSYNEKIKCVIIIPHEIKNVDNVKNYINNEFDKQLIVKDVLLYNTEIFENKYDIIFSIFDLGPKFKYKYYKLELFDYNKNSYIINDAINEYGDKKAIEFFKERLDYIFDDNFFYNNIDKKFKISMK